jgi:hypothetical protein
LELVVWAVSVWDFAVFAAQAASAKGSAKHSTRHRAGNGAGAIAKQPRRLANAAIRLVSVFVI